MSIVYPRSYAPGGLANPAGWFHNTNPTVAWSVPAILNYKNQFKTQFDKWAAVCGVLGFEMSDPNTDVASSEVPIMRLYMGQIDGASGANIAAESAHRTNDPVGSDIMYDVANFAGGDPNLMFANVSLHELGHALFGMVHNTEPGSVMNNGAPNSTLTVNDKARAVAYAGPVKTKAQELGIGGVLGRIYSAYQAIKNANPDNSGLHYWSRELTWAQVAGTTQYATRWQQFTDDLVLQASGWSNATFVTNMYVRILGRSPTPTEQANAVALLVGGTTRGNYLRTVVDSAEAATRRNGLWTGSKFWFN